MKSGNALGTTASKKVVLFTLQCPT